MKKKIIAIAVALVAIALIAYFGIGKGLFEKYSYGTEKADLSEYFGVSKDEAAIILENAKIADRALIKNGLCYLKFDTVDEKIGKGFYFDGEYNGGTLMFTAADGTTETKLDSTQCGDSIHGGEGTNLGYVSCFMEKGTLYIAADYVSRFIQCSCDVYDKHVRIMTAWDYFDAKQVTSNTQIRIAGGIKSPILREVDKGEIVELVEEMEEWSKVMTSDAIIGYIENKRMKTATGEKHAEPIAPDISETAPLKLGERVVLGFHSIAGVGGNDTIYGMIEEGNGMNVIAPTWFSLVDGNGNFRNFGTTDYVSIAHNSGLKVWAVLDDFNYRNETGDSSFSDLDILSDTYTRRSLEEHIVEAAVSLGVDGINLDFEKLSSECGTHYAQFIKELSVLTHKSGLVLSFDNYVPFNYNEFYRIDVQGEFADYVLIMGYDEHYHGSGQIGSVASFDYVASGLDKTMEMVPPERIINAVPFYTIVWKEENGSVSDSYLTLVNQAEFISKYNIQYNWDETTCQNYATWKGGNATYQVWFEDSESISAKLNAMNARNIGGVGVWRLGYGTGDVWNLIGMYKDMKKESN